MLKHLNYIINYAIGHFKILVMTPLFFFSIANSSIVAILELIRGAQCLIEVIRFSGEEV
jgi:hypothetical protein